MAPAGMLSKTPLNLLMVLELGLSVAVKYIPIILNPLSQSSIKYITSSPDGNF